MQVRAAGWLGQRGLLWFLSPRPAGRWVAPGDARPERNPVLTRVQAVGLLRALRSRKREGRVPRCHPLLCHQRTVSPRRGVLGEKWRRTLRRTDFGEPVFPGGLRALRCRPCRVPGVAAPPLPALGRSLWSAALPCLGLLEQQAAECHFLSLPEWHFLAGSLQLPPVVPELRAHGSVWLCPPPTAARLPAFAGRTRPAAGSLGGFRSVSRRSGAW